jgi:hypothetical protein
MVLKSPLLFARDELAQFAQQGRECVVVFFFLNTNAEGIHPLAFFWGHVLIGKKERRNPLKKQIEAYFTRHRRSIKYRRSHLTQPSALSPKFYAAQSILSIGEVRSRNNFPDALDMLTKGGSEICDDR